MRDYTIFQDWMSRIPGLLKQFGGVFWVSLLLGSAQAADMMTQAHELEAQGRWSEAVGLLTQNPPADAAHSASYHYNLGTASLRAGQVGAAVAHLEKAAQLVRGNRDVQVNLELARRQLGQAIGADRLDPGASLVERFAEAWPLKLLAALLSLLGAGLLLWRRGDALRTITGASAWALSLILGLIQWGALQSPAAMALSRTPIRSGPGDTYPQVSQIEAGVKVRLLDPAADNATGNAGWAQVRAGDDLIGWIPRDSLLE